MVGVAVPHCFETGRFEYFFQPCLSVDCVILVPLCQVYFHLFFLYLQASLLEVIFLSCSVFDFMLESVSNGLINNYIRLMVRLSAGIGCQRQAELHKHSLSPHPTSLKQKEITTKWSGPKYVCRMLRHIQPEGVIVWYPIPW